MWGSHTTFVGGCLQRHCSVFKNWRQSCVWGIELSLQAGQDRPGFENPFVFTSSIVSLSSFYKSTVSIVFNLFCWEGKPPLSTLHIFSWGVTIWFSLTAHLNGCWNCTLLPPSCPTIHSAVVVRAKFVCHHFGIRSPIPKTFPSVRKEALRKWTKLSAQLAGSQGRQVDPDPLFQMYSRDWY